MVAGKYGLGEVSLDKSWGSLPSAPYTSGMRSCSRHLCEVKVVADATESGRPEVVGPVGDVRGISRICRALLLQNAQSLSKVKRNVVAAKV